MCVFYSLSDKSDSLTDNKHLNLHWISSPQPQQRLQQVNLQFFISSIGKGSLFVFCFWALCWPLSSLKEPNQTFCQCYSSHVSLPHFWYPFVRSKRHAIVQIKLKLLLLLPRPVLTSDSEMNISCFCLDSYNVKIWFIYCISYVN